MRRISTLLGGWTALVFIFLYLPIVLLIAYSFNSSRQAIEWKSFTFAWYGQVWHDRELIDALYNSLIIASITTVISVVLGSSAAWLLYRYRFPASGLIDTLLLIPLVIPEVVMGVSLLALFIVMQVGLGYTTAIIAHVTFCFPFVMVGVRARLEGLDPSLEEAAMDLGATPLQAFLRIIVPYLLPAIISGALLSFALSMDEFIVTSFTASPEAYTLPIRIYGRARRGLDPSLNAISALFVVFTTILVLSAEQLRKMSSAAGGKG
jgi:spermidine/putrescine transport system permease protein